jgi:hypothetical protein
MALDAYKTAHKYQDKVNKNIQDFGALQVGKIMEGELDSRGMFDYEKFNDPKYNKKMALKIGQKMGAFAKQFVKSGLDPNNSEEAMDLERVSYGIFGFGANDTESYFNRAGDSTSIAGLGSYLQQNTAMGHMASEAAKRTKLNLSEDDKEAVINETGIRSKIHVERLRSKDDLAEIMGTYMSNDGAVPNSFLRGKHYARDNLEGRISTDTSALAGRELRV